jgi:hypothetical protein
MSGSIVGRLGRLPHDPAALERMPSLADHPLADFEPRPVVDRNEIAFEPGLYHNDKLPDCTAAGLANAANAVAALNGFQLAIVPEKVPQFYAACVGCGPTFAAMEATPGAVVLDVLNRQAVHGFDVMMQAPLVGLHAVIPHKRAAIANAVDRLGHAYFGVTLHTRDMDAAPVWDVGDGQPDGDVVGGHVVVGWDYTGLDDDATLRLCTWGRFQKATWRWLDARLSEAHAMIWRQLGDTTGHDVGVDFAVLEDALARIRTA